MEILQAYQTASRQFPFTIREYVTPLFTCDPRKQILQRDSLDFEHQRKQTKFKVTTKSKVSFFDEIIKSIKDFPEPSKYRTEGSLLKKRSKSASDLIKVNLKIKKNTYIENIEEYNLKHKPPGIGKYDLTKYSDFQLEKRKLKMEKKVEKRNNFDDVIKLADEVPGPGHFNPHIPVQKLHMNRTNFKFYQEKHKKDSEKIRKSLSAKLAPNTYHPVKSHTFEELKLHKSHSSRWTHGEIDIRKGYRSQIKEPSPSQYNTINQWGNSGLKQKDVGLLKVLDKIVTKSPLKGRVYE